MQLFSLMMIPFSFWLIKFLWVNVVVQLLWVPRTIVTKIKRLVILSNG